MTPKWEILAKQSAHVAVAAAGAALLAFAGSHSAQLVSALPAAWQGYAATFVGLLVAIKYQPNKG